MTRIRKAAEEYCRNKYGHERGVDAFQAGARYALELAADTVGNCKCGYGIPCEPAEEIRKLLEEK